MKKIIKELRSEKGAASVLEATIVLPIVFISVILLIFLGFTYAQRAFLQYHASQLSGYISKAILYPGYQYIEQPFYSNSGKNSAVTLNDVNEAMKHDDPYRYLTGLFNPQSKIKDVEGRNIVETSADKMVSDYLTKHGFLKASGGDLKKPGTKNFAKATVRNANGFMCAIYADTSKVSVYIAQNYMFASFFRMIGMGDKYTTISGQSTSFISDSVEFIRNTDMVFDVANMLAQKMDIDVDKIKEVIGKLTGNKK